MANSDATKSGYSNSGSLNGDKPRKTYSLQLLIQWDEVTISPIHIYSDEGLLIPVNDFNVSVVPNCNHPDGYIKDSLVMYRIDTGKPLTVNEADFSANDEEPTSTDLLNRKGSVNYGICLTGKNKKCFNLKYLKNSVDKRLATKRDCAIIIELSCKKLMHLNFRVKVTPKYGSSCYSYFPNGAQTAFIGSQFSFLNDSNQEQIFNSLIDENMNCVGHIKCSFLLIKPYNNESLLNDSGKKFTIKPFPAQFLNTSPINTPSLNSNSNEGQKNMYKPLMIGHRGSGKTFNESGATATTYMENSINSFIAAAEYGVDFVELDVQLTKDYQAVVYHDFATTILLEKIIRSPTGQCREPDYQKYMLRHTGVNKKLVVPEKNQLNITIDDLELESGGSTCSSINLSIKDLNLSQLRMNKFFNLHDKKLHEAAGNKLSATSSLDLEKAGNDNNHNSSKYSMMDPVGYMFPTLIEVLENLPVNIGVNIEVKNQQLMNTGQMEEDLPKHQDMFNKAHKEAVNDRNIFVDIILNSLLSCNNHMSERKIIFSSFDPWICTLLKRKQKIYPVLFLVEKRPRIEGYRDPRTFSIESAAAFATAEKLDGIVTESNSIIGSVDVFSDYVHANNLLFMTYGTFNNEIQHVKAQIDARVDGIIFDSVPKIMSAFKEL